MSWQVWRQLCCRRMSLLSLGIATLMLLHAESTFGSGADNKLGLGLPTPAGRANVEKEDLGKQLFRDTRLSSDGKISCEFCHKQDHAFSDGQRLARGVGGQLGTRNTPSLFNVQFNRSLFWDGRRSSLDEQAIDPLINPFEHGLRDESEVLSRIRSDAAYVAEFRTAFGVDAASIESSHVAQAIAAYERTLIAGDSAFDRFLYGHDPAALNPSAERGLALFRGSAHCSTCHIIGQESALLTDNQFHSVNVGLPRIASNLATLTTQVVAVRNAEARMDAAILSDPDIAELGRFVVTLDPHDIGKFRTPSLRNVALTAPYMHDGSVPTLEDAVERELYEHTDPSGRPLILTPQEKADLVAFLKALTSPTRKMPSKTAAQKLGRN